MNRIEFMKELEKLLGDIPPEEKDEALQYYRDYFDDAGAENEQRVIAEFGSPQKVAHTVKAGLRGKNDESSEYRETGYTDTRFEEKAPLAESTEYTYDQTACADQKHGMPSWVRVLLIIAAALIGIPIVIPIVLAVIAVILSLVCAGAALLGSLVITAAAVALSGLLMAAAGIAGMFAAPAVGLIICGAGLLLLVIGAIATVGMVKLCMIVCPPLFRWLAGCFRKLFRRKEENV